MFRSNHNSKRNYDPIITALVRADAKLPLKNRPYQKITDKALLSVENSSFETITRKLITFSFCAWMGCQKLFPEKGKNQIEKRFWKRSFLAKKNRVESCYNRLKLGKGGKYDPIKPFMTSKLTDDVTITS